MNLTELSKSVYITSQKRKQDPADVLKHCAGEVIEATIAKNQVDNNIFLGDKNAIKDLADELADVVLCCLSCAAYYSIDIEKAVSEKAEYNRKRVD